jgi:drug/metabolite transporter (DMT)-like permease
MLRRSSAVIRRARAPHRPRIRVSLSTTAPLDAALAAPARPNAISIAAAALFTVALFALTPITTRIAGAQIPGVPLGFIRIVGSGVFAVPLLVACRMPVPADMESWTLLLISSLGSFAGFPILFSIGVQLTSSSHAGLLMAALPLLTSTLGHMIEQKRPRDVWFIGTALAFTGELILMTRVGGDGMHVSLGGDLIVLLACILCSCGNAAGAQLAARINPLAATLWAITVASTALLPAAVLMAGEVDWQTLTLASWLALFHITAGASVLAYVSWFWALSRGGISRVATFQFVQPVLVLLFAAVILGEPIPAGLVGAAIVIVGGAALARRA